MKPIKYIVKMDMYIYANNDLEAKDEIAEIKKAIIKAKNESNPSVLELGKLLNQKYKQIK